MNRWVKNIVDIAIIVGLVIWGFGAAALYFLWRPDLTPYFKGASQRP